MSSVPTIPGLGGGGPPSGFLEAGAQGIQGAFDLSLDLCNARPIMVYVTERSAGSGQSGPWPPVQPPPPGAPPPPPPPPAPINRPPAQGAEAGGRIWRLIDPMSPTENLPVYKEWTEKKEYPSGYWKPIYRTEPGQTTPGTQPQPQRTVVRTEVVASGADQLFKFDEPGADWPPTRFPQAFTSQDAGAAFIAQVSAALSAPARVERDGQPAGTAPLPPTLERKIACFGHADMCAPFSYNHGLTHRRNLSIGMIMTPQMHGALLATGRSAGFAPCADFNPETGPNTHEQAAENSADGFATNPSGGTRGNQDNRRVELYVIPDHSRSSGKPSEIARIIDEIRSELMPASGLSASDWPAGQFPCPAGVKNLLGDGATLRPCHALTNPPSPHKGPGQGPSYRRCQFYQRFTERVRNLEVSDEQSSETPGGPPTTTPDRQVFDHWEWVDGPPVEDTQGEYHPPRGEHYSYYLDQMVRAGIPATDVFPPAVAVAPNDQVDPADFNLIRAGTIRVVKMDLGFWGDRRVSDPSRQAGFRRRPERYFGLVEGQFVFLCFFETPDNAGHVRHCSEGFDAQMTPLCDQLDQAARAAGFRILIMAKTVAEDGPDKQRLKVFFPDMHLPRKLDDADPTYANDDCTRRVELIRSMVLHKLKQDYRLPAEATPWLTTIDRNMCLQFFENNAPRLKLPHFYTLNGPVYANPLQPEGSNIVSQAVDAVQKAQTLLFQAGYRMFEFTQDDYRRMKRRYPQQFPIRGYGRTMDLLFNEFYGSTTDRNAPAPPESDLERSLKNLVPTIIQEGLDEHAGTDLAFDPGQRPPNESFATIDAGPARDLLRFLDAIRTLRGQRVAIDVFQTGDLYDLRSNRRFLFEDYHETDDPPSQIPDIMASLTKPVPADNPLGDFGKLAGDALLGLISGRIKTMLGGDNAQERDLWFRRESNKAGADASLDPDQQMLDPERGINVDQVNDPQLPRFAAPGAAPGSLSLTTPQGFVPPSVDYTIFELGNRDQNGNLAPFPAGPFRGRGYMSAETNRRMQQVEAFEAPMRNNAEDARLLGRNVVAARNGQQLGRWNRAIIDAFRGVRTTFIYGDYDCHRGVPRDNGVGGALPYYSEPGLWVEHGHRFDDNQLDGQPFGAFIANLAYEIQELGFAGDLLNEFVLHREQSLFQPGIIQWYLAVQFGGPDFLRNFQRPNENVPAVSPFRIAVTSHTHTPDLVNAQLIFKDREVAEVPLPFDVPLIGDSLSVESIVNVGGGILKSVLFLERIERWINAWQNRAGFEKWWADIGGNGIDWAEDFGGIARCLDRAGDFIRQQGQDAGRRLADDARGSAGSLRDAANDNLGAQGLPRI